MRTLALSLAQLLEILCKALPDVPPNAEIFLRIPDGDEWSNQELEVDRLYIRYKDKP